MPPLKIRTPWDEDIDRLNLLITEDHLVLNAHESALLELYQAKAASYRQGYTAAKAHYNLLSGKSRQGLE